MSFGKSFLASFLALIMFCIVVVVLFVVVIASSSDEVIVRSNSVLHLKLDAQITELGIKDPFDNLQLAGSSTPKMV